MPATAVRHSPTAQLLATFVRHLADEEGAEKLAQEYPTIVEQIIAQTDDATLVNMVVAAHSGDDVVRGLVVLEAAETLPENVPADLAGLVDLARDEWEIAVEADLNSLPRVAQLGATVPGKNWLHDDTSNGDDERQTLGDDEGVQS